MTSRRMTMTVALVLALSAHGRAQVTGGTAQLAGSAKLAVRGCGADREPSFSSTVTLSSDGTWTAAGGEGDVFAGTWVAVGSRGRRFDLFFDAATEAGLVETVTQDVGLLCDAPDVVGTSAARKRFTLTLNGARTKGKLVLKYVFKGRANNRSGSAGYRIRAKEPFALAA